MIKLHLGCGTVYLKGWTNVDMIGYLAKERPDLVKHNQTTIKKYYKYPFRKNKRNFVCDIHDDARRLGKFKNNSVDEILSVNMIDHMKKEDFLTMLGVWWKKLKPKGRLIIDVDERRKQAKILVKAKTIEQIEWGMRLLYCHQRNQWDRHCWGYTAKYLRHILKAYDFKWLWTRTDYIIHDMYPNFQICVEKP